MPPDWADWSNAYISTRVSGQVSQNAIRFVAAADQNMGLVTPAYTRGKTGAGFWVIEATVTLESGSLLGSGLHLQLFDGGGTIRESFSLNFASDPDATGSVQGAGSAGRTYRFTKLLRSDGISNDENAKLYAMAGWNGHGTRAAKTIIFHSAVLRPATPAEIAIGQATYGGQTLSAKLTDLTTVTTNLSTNKADASRVSSLESQARGFANLVHNSTFSQGFRSWPDRTSVWNAGYNSAWGSLAYASYSAVDAYIISDPLFVYAGNVYTLSFFADAGTAYANGNNAVYLTCFDGSGTIIADGVAYCRADVRDLAIRRSASQLIPTGTHYVKVAVRQAGGGENFNIGRIALHIGSEAMPWRDDATAVDTNARISTVETATTDGRFASASSFSTLNAEVTGARGGAGSLNSRLDTVESNVSGKASASSVSTLEARSISTPNLIQNPTFDRGFTGWGKDDGGNWDHYEHSVLGRIAWFQGGYIYTDSRSCGAGDAISLSFEGDGQGAAYANIQWLPSYSSSTGVSFPAGWGHRARLENQIAPAGTTGFRIVFSRGGATTVHVARVKANYGARASDWSDERTAYDSHARISAVETATTDGRFASASSLSTLTTEVTNARGGAGSLNSRLDTVQSDINGKASASSVSDLQARSGSNPNLLKNGGFEEGLTGFTGPGGMWVENSAGWGRCLRIPDAQTGTFTVDFADTPVFAGATYTVSGDSLCFGGGQVYFDLIFKNAGGSVVLDGGQDRIVTGSHDFANGRQRREAHTNTTTAPGDAAFVAVRAVFDGVSSGAKGVRQVKLELGSFPPTPYTAERTAVSTNARLNLLNSDPSLSPVSRVSVEKTNSS